MASKGVQFDGHHRKGVVVRGLIAKRPKAGIDGVADFMKQKGNQDAVG
jgi:hypothetical protein